MKYFIFWIAFLFLVGCSKDDSHCNSKTIESTSIENEYGCQNTTYQLDIDLNNDYMVIHNQSSFDSLVTGTCHPKIDFSKYDLIIGKKGLASANGSISYKLVKNCNTGSLKLTVAINQTQLDVAPNITYHRLIPKLKEGQEVDIEIKIIGLK